MTTENITPIRPDIEVPAPSKKRRKAKRDKAIDDALRDVHMRIERASDVLRVLADSLEGYEKMTCGAFPQDACLGVVDLLDSIVARLEGISIGEPTEE
jgi:hypothetical protein